MLCYYVYSYFLTPVIIQYSSTVCTSKNHAYWTDANNICKQKELELELLQKSIFEAF